MSTITEEKVYIVTKKDGTKTTVNGHFLKYDSGNTMIIRTDDQPGAQKHTLVAVVNMESVVSVAEETYENPPM